MTTSTSGGSSDTDHGLGRAPALRLLPNQPVREVIARPHEVIARHVTDVITGGGQEAGLIVQDARTQGIQSQLSHSGFDVIFGSDRIF